MMVPLGRRCAASPPPDRWLHPTDRRARRKYRPDMELYICSDHGMTPRVPFHRSLQTDVGPVGGRSTWMRRCCGMRASDDAGMPARRGEAAPWLSAEAIWLLDELDGIEAHLSRRGRKLTQALRRRLRERLPPDPASGWNLGRGSDVIVRSSGSLAHIYFNVTTDQMDVSEIAILYPDLVDALEQHPGIGLVLGWKRAVP